MASRSDAGMTSRSMVSKFKPQVMSSKISRLVLCSLCIHCLQNITYGLQLFLL